MKSNGWVKSSDNDGSAAKKLSLFFSGVFYLIYIFFYFYALQ